MTRKRKRQGSFDIIDIDRFTREVERLTRDCKSGSVYNDFQMPLKISSYLQTIYDGKAMETYSSSEDLHRYEERAIEAKCTNRWRKPGRKTSERSNRCRRGMRYPSDMKHGRRIDDLARMKNRTSHSSGDTMNYEENRRMNKYFEDVKKLERRYDKLFKKQRNKISVLTEMCQQCLEQCSMMSQVIDHNLNHVKVEETGGVGSPGHKLNGDHIEFHSVENEIKKASGNNVNCADSGELLAMEKYYEKLAQKLEDLNRYFEIKSSCDKCDNVTCMSCKKRGIVSSEMLSGVAGKSERDMSVKKSDKAVATDFGNDRGEIYLDETVFQESIQDQSNNAEHPCVKNYFTNMYCSMILDNANTDMGIGTRQQNAEQRTDSDRQDDEEFGLRNGNWQQIALRVLLAADAGNSSGIRVSNSCLKMNFPDLFPLSEEVSTERLESEGLKFEIPRQTTSKVSSFNLDDPVKLYKQCQQFNHQHGEFNEETCKSRTPTFCEYLRGVCRRGTTFCDQLLFCRLR